jgi:hypothetical protein
MRTTFLDVQRDRAVALSALIRGLGKPRIPFRFASARQVRMSTRKIGTKAGPSERRTENRFSENTHRLKGHKGTIFFPFFYSTVRQVGLCQAKWKSRLVKASPSKNLKIPHRCTGEPMTGTRSADCANPQRVDSQTALSWEQHVESWRSRCELGQLALHCKATAMTFCLRTVSRCAPVILVP